MSSRVAYYEYNEPLATKLWVGCRYDAFQSKNVAVRPDGTIMPWRTNRTLPILKFDGQVLYLPTNVQTAKDKGEMNCTNGVESD